MLTAMPITEKDGRPAYRPYRATVRAVTALSPHFVRVTFFGAAMVDFGTDLLDQRIKILFPMEHGPLRGTIADVGVDDPETIARNEWYSRWRALPEAERSPFRTYTIRAVRREAAEIDVDMVVHAEGGGPASRWISAASVGDEVIVVGPDANSLTSAVGIDFHPGGAREVLLAGDETAAPAICSILEMLPAGVAARAFIEIPEAGDQLPVEIAPGVSLTWLARHGADHGSVLDPAVRAWVEAHPTIVRPALAESPQLVEDVDVDTELLWESPGAPSSEDFYAWIAGESAMVKLLRRFLVSETGIDRKRVAFMGYWRMGRAEAQ